MKSSFLILGISIAGLAAMPSCTKNLKDDIKDLQTQVDSLERRNAALKDQAKATQNILGSDEPITATTTFEDATGTEKQYQDTYSLKSGDYSTQYMVGMEDGTYVVYIERFLDINWNEGAWAEFRYDPTTKSITPQRGGQYWRSPNYNNAYYTYGSDGCDIKIDLKNIDLNTGKLSFDFTATGSSTYTAGGSWPNPGQAHTTKFSFTGKAAVLKRGS